MKTMKMFIFPLQATTSTPINKVKKKKTIVTLIKYGRDLSLTISINHHQHCNQTAL